MPLHLPDGNPVDTFVQLAQQTPFGIRGLAGLVGGLVLLAGARLYRLAIVAPGLVGGLLLGSSLPVSPDPVVQGIFMAVLALVGGLACHLLERVAIHAIGAVVVAGVVNAAWPLVAQVSAPWWGPVGGAVLGLFLFPAVFKALLPWITALLGAVTVAWAAGWSDKWWAVGALALVGAVVQIGVGRGKEKEEEE